MTTPPRSTPENTPAGGPTDPAHGSGQSSTPRGDRPPATGWRLHMPNALTVLRLVLAVGCFIALAQCDFHLGERIPSAALLIAAGLFVVAAITDALDGYLARRWHAITRFGRVVDPFADKILVLGAFVMLAGGQFVVIGGPEGFIPRQVSGIEPWMVVVILARELLITSLRGLVEQQGGDFSAAWPGKIKMIVQSVAIPLILVILALSEQPAEGISRQAIVLTGWAVTLVTVWSAVPYIARAAKALR